MAFNKAAIQALSSGYSGSSNDPFAKAGKMVELPTGRKYATNPFGGGSLPVAGGPFAQAQTRANAASKAPIPVAQPAAPKPVVQAAPAATTTPDLSTKVEAARKPVNWAAINGVPVINKPEVNYTEVSPVITPEQEEASRLKNVDFQDAQHKAIIDTAQQGELQDSIAAAQSANTMLDAQAAGAMSMIQQGTLGGIIQGQMILDSVAKQKAANASVTGTTLGAQVNSQKNLVDLSTHGNTSLAQLIAAQNEQALTKPRISLIEAQAAQAAKQGELMGKQATLADVQARYYPDTITAKNQQYADEQANKNVEIQQKMMNDVIKMSEMEILANPGNRDAIIQKNIKTYLKNLPK